MPILGLPWARDRHTHDTGWLDRSVPNASFPDLVRSRFDFLLTDHEFEITEEQDHDVCLESSRLRVRALHDPRGEVVVNVTRVGHDDGHERWTYAGMVGRASVDRLLEIAAERMRENSAILAGDAAFYEQLGREHRQTAEEWTAYSARKGPRPRRGPLP
jgi:hypothetical protein